jgi:predicted O-methyltransferase YrrM
MEIDLPPIVESLELKLQKATLNSRVLLDRMRVIDEDSRKSPAYTDPRHTPFYYYLGGLIQPKSMVEVGFRLGLSSGCFFNACKTVENFLAFQEKVNNAFYSPRMGEANVKDNYKGNIDVYAGKWADPIWAQKYNAQEWDLALINDDAPFNKYLTYLNFIWPQISENGLIVMDYVNYHKSVKDAIFSFSKAKNRKPTIINTRYGVGIIQK